VSSVPAGRTPVAETVAGFLAAIAIAIAVVAVAWHPLRLLAPALFLSLLAAGIGGRFSGLAQKAVFTVAACFFLGMVVAVTTSRPLW
jgi:hypothetical protein